MKNLKLLMASLVVSCFFITTNVNAQGNSSQVDYGEGSFYCPCAGEELILTYAWHEVMNKKFYHSNMKVDAVGATTGENYVIKEIWRNNLPYKPYENEKRVFNITQKGKKITTDYYMIIDGDGTQIRWHCDSGAF